MAPFLRAVATFAAIYCLYGVVMVAVHRSRIYPFSPEPFAVTGYERVLVPVPGADPVPVQVHRAEDPEAPAVLYFMGNAGSLAYFDTALARHTDAGRSVIAMEYRGGAGVPGRPSETRLKADALAVHDWALANGFVQERLAVQGYSLGSGLAIHVAANRPVAALVLVAPFTRLCELMARASYLPACLMPFVDRWNSLALVPQISVPVLILHGTADQVIPVAQGRRLAEALAAGGNELRLVEVPGADHVSIGSAPEFTLTLEALMSAIR